MTNDRVDDLVAGVSALRDEIFDMAKQLASNSVILEGQAKDICKLNVQMKTALMPIMFAKWLVAICAGLSTIGGVIYALIKLTITL